MGLRKWFRHWNERRRLLGVSEALAQNARDVRAARDQGHSTKDLFAERRALRVRFEQIRKH